MGIQMRCHFVPILIRSEAFWLQRGGVHFAIVLPNGNTLRPTREAGLVQIAESLTEFPKANWIAAFSAPTEARANER